MARPQGRRRIVGRKRFIHPPHAVEQIAEIVLRIRKLAAVAQRVQIGFLRRFQLTGLGQRDSQIVVGVGIILLPFDRLAQRRNRLRILPLTPQQVTQRVVVRGNRAIGRNRPFDEFDRGFVAVAAMRDDAEQMQRFPVRGVHRQYLAAQCFGGRQVAGLELRQGGGQGRGVGGHDQPS